MPGYIDAVALFIATTDQVDAVSAEVAALDAAKISVTEKGANNGVAPLGATGKLLASALDFVVVNQLGNLGASVTLGGVESYAAQVGTLTANTVVTLPAAPATGAAFTLKLLEDATGGRTPTFAATGGDSITYPAGAVSWTTTANAENLVWISSDVAGRWNIVPITGVDAKTETLILKVGDETTTITTGVAKRTFRMPWPFTVTAVRASLATASSSGIPTFDINEAGTTILSTKLTVDANEKTSTTAATPAVISDAAIADDAEMTIDVDVAGTGAAGLTIVMIGTRA